MCLFFFKQKTAYEMRISDWSSDVCSSDLRRREKGLARAGNVRVRHAMIQFAWRFLRFQPDSELTRWYRGRTEGVIDARKTLRKKLIVALARKLLVALWRMVTTGEVPDRTSVVSGKSV